MVVRCARVVVVALVAVLTTVSFSVGTTTAVHPYPHLLMGNPSGADCQNRDNWLLEKQYFAVSYNDSLRIPNWVSWRLTQEELGTAPRPSEFRPDTTLPSSFVQVHQADYDGSGFDRGHMCPHSDRNVAAAMSSVTFVMSNVIPQSNHNNERAWESLEKYCRELVEKQNKVLYIVCGPAGKGGVGRLGFKTTISRKNIRVPNLVWKVVLVLNDRIDPMDLPPGADVRLICVVTPNDESPTRDWARYRTSLREVETLTGYRFFGESKMVRDWLLDHVDDVEVRTD